MQFLPDSLKNPIISLMKSSVSFIKPNVVLTFLSALERKSQFWVKRALKRQRSNQVSGEEDKQKCHKADMKFFYQEVNEVKILKRSAKAESLHAPRAELGLQEYCTQSRIRSKGCMMLLQTELMKNITLLNTDLGSDWEVCNLLQKLITLHYLFFVNRWGILLSHECLAR